MKMYFTLILIILICALYSTTRSVKQNGSGDFTSIQAAINASNSDDIIIVYPGTYFENIDYSGKNITIGSLEMTSGNPAYRDSTIIDGNNNGSCVKVVTNENNASINGFTIQHGSGTPWTLYGANLPKGGGIKVKNAINFTIQNCIIKDNKAAYGGGLNVAIGSVVLIDNTIYNNYASNIGGGILFEGNGRAIFDQNDRCSVYENYAGLVNDISAADSGYIMDVYLDFFTVSSPTDYYIYYSKSYSHWPGYFNSINVLQGYRTEINHDLYLSPTGDDSNDGFSPATPLKSISKAFHTIASDSLNPKTIYLAPGVYSSEDEQLFPINMKAYVNLIGDTGNPPVIQNLDYSETLMSYRAPGKSIANLIFEHGENHPTSVFNLILSSDTMISNLTINPVQAITFAGLNIINSKCTVENVHLNGLSSNSGSGIIFFCSEGTARNCVINNCHVIGDDQSLNFPIICANMDSLLILENLSVTNCSVNYPDNCIIGFIPNDNQNPIIRITNLLVANNQSNGQAPILMDSVTSNRAKLTNCSFINNSGFNVAAKIIGSMNISNCIFDNDTLTEIDVRSTIQYGFLSNMNFNNNLIRNYPASVYVHPSNTNVIFNEFNLDADPGLVGGDWANPLSYRLYDNSPCIDAGIQDTTGLYLPEFDLFDNPRIFNERIDIGCNEWSGTGNADDNTNPPVTTTILNVSPNPFVQHTVIRYTFDKIMNNNQGGNDSQQGKGDVSIIVYNIKGQKIKTVVNKQQAKGEQITYWDGINESGRPCSTGIYVVKLFLDGKPLCSKKITLVK